MTENSKGSSKELWECHPDAERVRKLSVENGDEIELSMEIDTGLDYRMSDVAVAILAALENLFGGRDTADVFRHPTGILWLNEMAKTFRRLKGACADIAGETDLLAPADILLLFEAIRASFSQSVSKTASVFGLEAWEAAGGTFRVNERRARQFGNVFSVSVAKAKNGEPLGGSLSNGEHGAMVHKPVEGETPEVRKAIMKAIIGKVEGEA